MQTMHWGQRQASPSTSRPGSASSTQGWATALCGQDLVRLSPQLSCPPTSCPEGAGLGCSPSMPPPLPSCSSQLLSIAMGRSSAMSPSLSLQQTAPWVGRRLGILGLWLQRAGRERSHCWLLPQVDLVPSQLTPGWAEERSRGGVWDWSWLACDPGQVRCPLWAGFATVLP